MKLNLQTTVARGATFFSVTISLLVLSCTSPGVTGNESGGSSSEVVALVGSARNSDGSAAANATVRLRPSDYLPESPSMTNTTIADIQTDNRGSFRIDSVTPGDYTIEIADRKSSGAVHAISATLDSNEVHLEPIQLKPLSKVSGTTRLPAGKTVPVYVMVYGLERRVLADSTGAFTINDLPEGVFAVRISPAAELIGPCDVPKVVVTASSAQTIDTVRLHTFIDENYSSWMSSHTIRINTSLSGANVGATITDFPLLVRLDNSNFDFTKSLSYTPGADIRFANPDGKHLPCRIERWDAALHKAEIWVRIDTVFGNDSAQLIKMYCGKSDAALWTGGNVFDTAAGFAAVWHLGDNLDDATVNRNTGTDVKTEAAEGLIGKCRYFDGISSFIRIDSSASLNMTDKSPTILLWERSSQSYTNERMFFEHDIWPTSGDYGFSTRKNTALSFDFPTANSEVRYDGKPVNDNAWHLVAATKDNRSGSGTIYFDSDSVVSGSMLNAIGSSDGRSFIGSRGGQERFFAGYLDEMWILSRPLSSAFIKLVYENQRPGQVLVSVQ